MFVFVMFGGYTWSWVAERVQIVASEVEVQLFRSYKRKI